MPFKDILNDAKKKHEEETAASENKKKLEDERQQLIDNEFNLLTQKVISLLEEVRQYYPKFENCIVVTPNKRMLKVAWDIHTEIKQYENMKEGYEVYDSIVTYPPSIQFTQTVNHELRRFFIEVNADGNCYYCDGKEKQTTIHSSPSYSETVCSLEQVLLGNITDSVSIIPVLQKIIANRIIKENFPRIELSYGTYQESFNLPEEDRIPVIEKIKQKLPKLMTEDEAIIYTLQKDRDKTYGVKIKKVSLEYFLK